MSVKNVVFPYHWEYGNSMEGDPASNAPKWAKWLAIASIMIPFVALAIFGMLPSSIVENISSEVAAVIFGVIAISMLVFLLVGLAICFGVQISGSKKANASDFLYEYTIDMNLISIKEDSIKSRWGRGAGKCLLLLLFIMIAWTHVAGHAVPIAVWALMPLCLGALKGRKFVRVIQIQEVDEVVDANKEGAVMLRGKFGESCIYGKSIDIKIIKDVINKQRRAPLRSVLLG